MAKQTRGTLILTGTLAATVFVVAYLLLTVIGGFTFSPAFFLALAVAVVVALVLYLGFHRRPQRPVDLEARRGPVNRSE